MLWISETLREGINGLEDSQFRPVQGMNAGCGNGQQKVHIANGHCSQSNALEPPAELS